MIWCVFTLNSYGAALEDGALTGPLGGKPDPDWGKIIYVNGVRTNSDDATAAAIAISQRLNAGVHLIFNDLRLDGVRTADRAIALAIEKVGDCDTSVDAATQTLKAQIKSVCEGGKNIWLLGHSAGCLCIQNAIRCVDDDWRENARDRRDIWANHIKLVYAGGAVFSDDHDFADETPDGISRFDIYDRWDGIAQFAGVADWGKDTDAAHSFMQNYLDWVTPLRFGQTGELMINRHSLLREIVAKAPDEHDRVVRIRVDDLRKTQESRRTRVDFAMPWKAEKVHWSVESNTHQSEIVFTVMEDISFGPDEAKSDPLSNDVDSVRFGEDNNYIGRVGLRGVEMTKEAEGKLWNEQPSFYIVVRPK